MDDCIFCKISSGKIESNFLYEDDDVVIVNDINPKATTHFLIISKKHIGSISNLEDSDGTLIGKMVLAAKKIASEKSLKGYKLLFNVGKEGGQEIFHIHLHLLSNS